MVIIERLVRAANRGVRVRIMSRALHKLKKKKLFEGVSGLRIVHDVGAKVRSLRELKLHGKIMIADNERAIVGSINLSPGSFDDRRELAIETAIEACHRAPGRDRASRLEALAQAAAVRRGGAGRPGRAWRKGCQRAGAGSQRKRASCLSPFRGLSALLSIPRRACRSR